MPFIKYIKPAPDRCKSPEHQPPSMIALPAGIHVWECPACGHKSSVYISEVTV